MKHAIRGKRWLVTAVGAAALFTVSAWASAATHYVTNFTTLNDSGVTGRASVTLDNDMLTVHINASGLEKNQTHVAHIHGTFDSDGNPTDAMTPGAAQDSNGDGLITVTEGAATYGAILLPLAPFSDTPDGTLDFTHTYDLTDSSVFNDSYSESDLMPLNFREIVLHGLTTPKDISNAGLDGSTSYAAGDYVATLPVASGELVAAVPEPAEWGMMAGGLSLLLGFLWLRRRVDA